jgi:hypothetical protein
VNDERLHDLQERFAWLERQATDRDSEMLGLAERIRRLERQIEKLNEKAEQIPEDGPPLPNVEKPPHY